ncbi:hypothetical protein [Streptomyces minutiscleroticus]|uniref:hypothetical protein n=1 Tax=Streptomyces minutiscleroticus TaxID=68238 RepID=UPI003326F893
MTAGWCSRTVRAAVFAAVCVLLAALGHVVMPGSDVPAWALAAGAAGTGAAGWCLAGRERGLPLIVAVVVAAQTALHSAFSLARSSGPGGPASGSGGGTGSMTTGATGSRSVHMGMGTDTGMDMGLHTGAMPPDPMSMGSSGPMNSLGSVNSPGPLGTGHTAVSHMEYMEHMGHSMDAGPSSSGMLAAHLLAALLCGLWLAHGEKAAFRILRAVAGRLAAPLRLLLAPPLVPDRPRLRPRRPRSDRAPALLLLVHAITSRGPPVGTAVV